MKEFVELEIEYLLVKGYEGIKIFRKQLGVGGKTQRVWRNDEVKAAVRRKEKAWKRVMAASDEENK